MELHRRRELLKNPHASPPQSPREAALRYFDLPPLDLLPKMQADGITIRGKLPRAYASDLAANVKLRLIRSMKPVEYTVVIEDAGMGQSPLTAHKSFLSLGQSDKGDKPYLIGVFGQGGSSTFAASEYSWIISRRAPDLGDDPGHEVAWTVVRKIVRPGRQQFHWA
ncbi:MAG: hypothetical protein ACRENE_12755, partial [Polyangiaceae bacterium]